MNKILIRILNHALGGLIGFVFGLLLMPIFLSVVMTHEVALFLMLTTLLGILISVIVFERQNSIFISLNYKAHNEAVALITHEMRTGLTSTGWAILDVLEKYQPIIKPEDVKMLQDVYASIHTTVMHSVDLLDVSLLDKGKLAISLQWTTLDKVSMMFNETIERYKMGAERNNIKLTFNILLDPTRQAEVDLTRLRVMLENLLENALQYTKGDIREIKIDITNNKTEMSMSVSDSGVGIPLSEQPKIFSEFYRASNARKMLSSGSGIGLYLCAQYTHAHHGKIWFESIEGKGTTFFITIPLKTAADVNEFLVKV